MERKRALLLLQRLAPAGQMASPGWALWGALYDILDEFPIHLVAPMWAKVRGPPVHLRVSARGSHHHSRRGALRVLAG